MTIIVNQDSLNLISQSDLLTINVSNNANNINTLETNALIYSNNPVLLITPTSSEGRVTSAGIQGPQGLQGPIGPSGGSSLSHITPIDLGGNRVVTASFTYASSDDISTVSKAIGITTGSALATQLVSIILSGELGSFYGLIPDGVVYLSTNGTISQSLPSNGYIQKVGVALDATTLLIHISEPIVI